MAPGTAVGPLAALLTPAPAASARHTKCWKKAAFKPATLHFSLGGQETELDFRGVYLSSHCTNFFRNVLHSPVHVHRQPHSLLGCEGTVGLSWYQVTLLDGD